MELVHVLGQGTAAGLIGLVDDIPHLAVNLGGSALAVALAHAQIAAQEGLLLGGAVDHRAQPLGETVLGDHLAGDVGGLLQVVGSTGGDVVQDQLFGHAAAQTGDDILKHLALGDVAAVFFGQVHGVAAGLAAGDNGNLMDAGVMLAVEARHRVARLVIGGELFLFGGDDPALLLGAGHDLHGSFLNVLHGDGLAVAPGSQQSCLVDQVLQVGAGKTGGPLGDHLEGDVRGQGFIPGVDLEDLLAALDIGQTYIDLTVETAGTEQSFIQDIGPVGGRDDDNAVVGLEAVHLHQQLVQSLLTLIVAAAQTGAALAAHRVNLIDEHDAGHGLFGLVEQVADTGSAHADVHFHEIRARNRVKRHPRLAGAGTGQQGFTGTRRAHQQNAVGNPCAQGVEFVGALEELHHLLQFLFFLVLARDIGKGGGLLVLGLVLDLGAAHIHNVAACAAAPEHGEEDEAGAAQHGQVEQDLHPGDGFFEGHIVIDHRGVGVGLVVRLDVAGHVLHEHGGIGQLVAHRNGAVLFFLDDVAGLAGGQHAGEQPAGALGGRLVGLTGQRQVAFFDLHGDYAGIPVQRKLGHLQVLEVVDHRGIGHGRAG